MKVKQGVNPVIAVFLLPDGNVASPALRWPVHTEVPPRDPHAPTRPDSAYVAYTKAQRQDPEVAKLPFIEIAKLVGDRWTHLPRDIKDVWNQNAGVEKDKYKASVAAYHQTEAYREYRQKIQSKLMRKNTCEDRVNYDDGLPQDHLPEPISNVLSRTTDGELYKILKPSEDTQQVKSELVYCSSTAPASTAHTINSTESSSSNHHNCPDLSVFIPKDSGPDVALIKTSGK